jgi:ribosomal protein L11 methyltransferase
MDEVIRVERGNLLDGVRGRAHLIVSNIAADVIIRMCGTIGAHLEHEGIFIASGIIGDRLEEVKKAFEDNGLEIVERLRRNDWRALAARVKG